MQILLVLFSAVLLPLALPNELFPAGLAIPGLIALTPAFLTIYRAPSRISASRLGALFGAVSTVIGNYWLAFFGEFSVWTIGGTVLGYTGYNYMLFGFLYFLSRPSDAAKAGVTIPRPLVIAVAWTGYEYLKSVGFLGYPWGLIAYPIAELGPAIQIAEMTGPWGLSFLGAYSAAAVAELIAKRGCTSAAGIRRSEESATAHVTAAASLIILASLFGTVRLSQIRPVDEVQMLLVQQNVDSWQPGQFDHALLRAQELTLQGLSELPGRENTKTPGPSLPDAVVWSETSLRVPYHPDREYYSEQPRALPFHLFLRLIDTPLISGTALPVADTKDYTNSAVVILPDGTTTGAYGKQQLVPFAESIPFWSVTMVQRFFRNTVGLTGTWVPGRDSLPLTLPRRDRSKPDLRIGTPICFEDAFGWVTREMVAHGADVLVNLTNNSWSRQDSAQTQHFAAARLRTVELRTTLVRGTNSGLSGVIDARGELISELPMFESVSKMVNVPLYPQTWTLYRAWGDWLGILSFVVTLVSVVKRTKKKDEPASVLS